MQTGPTAGILAKLRAMLRGEKSTAEAQPPEPVAAEPSEPGPARTPVAAAQPPAKED
jgi:hypothetical protein